jgi:hypothetical protein
MVRSLRPCQRLATFIKNPLDLVKAQLLAAKLGWSTFNARRAQRELPEAGLRLNRRFAPGNLPRCRTHLASARPMRYIGAEGKNGVPLEFAVRITVLKNRAARSCLLEENSRGSGTVAGGLSSPFTEPPP